MHSVIKYFNLLHIFICTVCITKGAVQQDVFRNSEGYAFEYLTQISVLVASDNSWKKIMSQQQNFITSLNSTEY